MKCIFLFSICVLFTFLSLAQSVDPSKYSSPIKVACIGNSITYGSGIDNRPLNSYPAQLQRMLGDNWVVHNFGIEGCTMLKKGDLPFWNEEAYKQAKDFLPDVIVIKLGTNDTKPQNWKFSNEFYSDYKAMVLELKSLPSHPQIFICNPVPIYTAQWRVNDSIIVHGVIPTIEKLGKEEKLQVIDLYTRLSGKSELFPDHIHPNAEGAGLLAKAIHEALTGNEQIDIGQRKGISDNITLGVIIHGDNPEEEFKQIKDLGFSHCQLNISEYSHELAKRLRAAIEKFKVYPTTLICMGPGDYIWNFTDGPSTIGLIPRKFREARIKRLRQGIDFCNEVGIPAIHAHFGFIPEDPKDTLYLEFIQTMKELGKYALNKGIDIYFETGQETPVTLLRAINDIGTGNLFVNYDLANLVMYGKANSLDGLKVLHNYIKALHAKDGEYPTEPYHLGKEVPIPHGEADFPAVVAYLKQINFKGNITIEYEISDKNYDYIIKTKRYLEGLIFNN